ncbi:MAG: inovirus-type Gp2 protein [Campylobacter sp.]|nr:inovirus-type Gp2 protein [Campylobacter sp.]
MKQNNRKTLRRYKQGCTVIDSSLELDSRVAVIRLDLSCQNSKGSADRLNSDLNKLRLNARSNPSIFKDQIGYVIKLEKGDNDNYHAHALFTFREHEVKNHKYKAEQLGKYWQEVITKGNGIYHNCNTKEYDKNCLGVIERSSVDDIEELKENVLGYLCKDEQSIKNSDGSDKKIREFRCSVIKK